MTKDDRKKRDGAVLCLVDGTALAYRSYYAFVRRPLLNSRGENVSAVYGFASSVIKLLTDMDPSHIAVAFDCAEPTFRHEEYEDYKATREEMPDEMADQLPAIHEFVESLGFPILEVPGFEADDLIGTMAEKAVDEGMRVVIVSGDKDFFQMVDNGITVFDPAKSIAYDAKLVEETFGVPPARVVEVLGLMGDSSDNVPGVPGVGKKTALYLIRTYGTIEEVMAHLEDISGPKRRQNLEENEELAYTSRRLVTIDRNAPVEFDPGSLERRPVDSCRVASYLREHEFPSLLKQLLPEGTPEGAEYRTVSSLKELKSLARRVKETGRFALDVETSGLDPVTARVVGVSLAFEEGSAFYLPVGHAGEKTLMLSDVKTVFGPILDDPGVEKVGQNIKFDMEVLSTNSLAVSAPAFDTMIASYLLDPGRRQHGLAALALEHLDVRMSSIESLIGKGSEQLSFADVDVSDASDYACADADVTLRLAKLLGERLRENGLTRVFEDIEMPLVPVLARMELRGVALETGVLDELNSRLKVSIEELRHRVCDLAGVEFNIDSPKQVGSVLFEKLKLPKGRRTKTGYSTDTGVLESLRETHEVPALILDYRQLRKLKTGYLDALPKLVNEKTGRVHTSFNQTIAATGRLSSSNPNLQNIPVRTELGREIRRAFVAGEGRLLLSVDYSQIELRLMAHLSGDPGLREAFERGKDVHRSTASLLFDVSESDVTQEQRDWAKMVNFGIMYGMGRFGLARRMGMDTEDAAEFIDRYFEMYPGVAEYTERAISEARELGFAVTMAGRRRPIAGLDSDNARTRGLAERVAVNTPIQGSAADLIKLAMIRIDRLVEAGGLDCDMLLQVHDELVFEVDEDAVDEVSAAVVDVMENPEQMAVTVPVVANAAWGSNWLEAHA